MSNRGERKLQRKILRKRQQHSMTLLVFIYKNYLGSKYNICAILSTILIQNQLLFLKGIYTIILLVFTTITRFYYGSECSTCLILTPNLVNFSLYQISLKGLFLVTAIMKEVLIFNNIFILLSVLFFSYLLVRFYCH